LKEVREVAATKSLKKPVSSKSTKLYYPPTLKMDNIFIKETGCFYSYPYS
jgi:hypothetical protein